MEHLRIREDAVEHVLANDDALDRQGQGPPDPTKVKVIAATKEAANARVKNPWGVRWRPQIPEGFKTTTKGSSPIKED